MKKKIRKPSSDDGLAKAEHRILNSHPSLDVYFRISDGTPFFNDTAGKRPAKSLEDKTIDKITKK